MTYEETLSLCRGYVKDHELTVELDTPNYKAIRMKRPGTRAYSMLILFTPEGITIVGDYRVTKDRGLSSDPGYGLDWFAGVLGSDYLASKFLRERWVPEHCAKALLEKAEEVKEEATGSEADGFFDTAIKLTILSNELRAIADQCHASADVGDIYDMLLEKAPGFCDDGMPGHTWDYMERASLQAIQEKFAELYNAMSAAKV